MTYPRHTFASARNIAGALGAAVLLAGLLTAPAAFATEAETPPEAAVSAVSAVEKAPETAVEQTAETAPTVAGEPEATPDDIADPAPPLPAADPAANPNQNRWGVQATPAAVAPGDTVKLTSSKSTGGGTMKLRFTYLSWPGTTAGEDSNIDFRSEVLTDQNGLLNTQLTIPTAVAPGEYTLGYSCKSGDVVYCHGSFAFTVLGDVPTERPTGAVLTFAADPLEGEAGAPLNTSGECTYNGASGDAVHATWVHAGHDFVTRQESLGEVTLNGDGRLSKQFQVPAEAKPKSEGENFDNGLSLECHLGAIEVGSRYFGYTVVEDTPGTPIPPDNNPGYPEPGPCDPRHRDSD